MKTFRFWTQQEDELLRKMWCNDITGNFSDLEQALGRTARAIRKRAYNLGLGTSRRLSAKGKTKYKSTKKHPRPWEQEEIDLLVEKWSEWGIKKIAKKLRRSEDGVRGKAAKLNLKTKDAAKPVQEGPRTHPRYKPWTAQELEQLQEEWGYMDVDRIARTHGRTAVAIKERARILGLGSHLEAADVISLARLIMLTYGYDKAGMGYKFKKEQWVNSGLPLRSHRVHKDRFCVVKIDEFWKWAKEHQDLINFANFEEDILGVEPAWVKQKRKVDSAHKVKRKVHWSAEEDELLRSLLAQHKYGYTELAQRFTRTQAAIKRRIYDLKIKDRPVRRKPEKWTEEQTQIAQWMKKQGYTRCVISEKIGKTEGAIQNRLEFIKQTGEEWAQGELTYLKEHWCRLEVSEIARRLNRTVTEVRRKASHMRLHPDIDENGNVDLCEVMQCIYRCDLNKCRRYKMRDRWIKAGIPVFGEKPDYRINMADFWEWAERNQNSLNFARFTEGHLGAEPAWVREKRRSDRNFNSNRNNPWTKTDDKILCEMVNAYRYTIQDISDRLNRSEMAIRRRIQLLKLAARPIPLDHKYWNDEEVAQLLKMREDGITYKEMARRLNRSEMSVYGKLFLLNNPTSEEKQ